MPMSRRKALGQNFLRNAAAADRIVEILSPRPGEPILEIGPGRGVLTSRLLERGARVVAVEKDEALADLLRSRLGPGPDTDPEGDHPEARPGAGLDLIAGDALEVDLGAILRPHLLASGFAKARVLANLPYSVGTAILARLLCEPALFASLTVMLQREVAERACAGPGSRVYGSLSVLTQYFTTPQIRMHLGPGSFQPPPKVASAVVEMPFREERELAPDAERRYPPFVRALFNQRRKMLPHNLAGCWNLSAREAAARLERIGIDPARRPETLRREECLALFIGV